MLLFSLDPHCTFAATLATALDETLAPHEDRSFADGEYKTRSLVDPRGADAYVLCSLHGGPVDSPNDKLVGLLMFAASLRDHGAARVTAVVPYLAYARKDRRTQPWDPVSLRYVAQMFEAVGIEQVIVLEAHNVAAFENAFRCTTLHLPIHSVFEEAVRGLVAEAPVAVASPDPGGVKRAQLWRESLQDGWARPVGFAMVDKRRSAGLISGGSLVAGDVREMTVLLFDDLIASGETLRRAALALRHAGARQVIGCAGHGLFIEPASQVLADPALQHILVTDSVPSFRVPALGPLHGKLRIVTCVPLLAQAIRDCRDAWAR